MRTLLRYVPVVPVMLAVLALVVFAGCTATKRRVLGRQVEITNVASVVPERGPVGDKTPKIAPLFGVIVENARGSVTLLTDPMIEVPEVRAKVSGLDDRASRRSGTVPTWVAASIERFDNINTLQVLAVDPTDEQRSVDLRIVVPATAFVSVTNSHGNVEIRGVSGNLQVNNGLTDGMGGRVDVRTDKAIKDGAMVRVRGGDVYLAFGKGSAGPIDARAKAVHVRADGLVVKDVTADRTSYEGVLGSLGKPMLLRVPDGKLTLFIDE